MGYLSDRVNVVKNNAGLIGAGAGFAIGGPMGAAIGGSIGGKIQSDKATSDAAATGAAATKTAQGLQQSQYNQTRSDFNPYMQAATGTPTYGGGSGRGGSRMGGALSQMAQMGRQTGTEGGALNAYQAGIGNAPALPQSTAFGGQAVNAPTLNSLAGPAAMQQFQGDAAQAQALQSQTGGSNQQGLQFDPNTYLQSDAAQAQLAMANQAQDRLAGKNRSLSSGNRAVEAAKYATTFANQNMNDEFQRQNIMNQSGNQANQQNFQNQFGNTQANNQNAMNRFNMDLAGTNQGMGINQLQNQSIQQGNQNALAFNQAGNQIAKDQFGLNTQQLQQEQSLNAAENQRLRTDYGLANQQYSQGMDQNLNLMNMGMTAAGQVASAGQGSTNAITGLIQSNAKNQAAAGIANNQSMNNLIGQGIQAYGMYNSGNPGGGYNTTYGPVTSTNY